MKESFQELLTINRGHFALESGLHGDVWFDLENVFLRPALLQPFIDRLAGRLSKYDLSAVCGALVGGAFVGYAAANLLGIDFFYTEREVSDMADGALAVSYRLPKPIRQTVAGRRIGVVD